MAWIRQKQESEPEATPTPNTIPETPKVMAKQPQRETSMEKTVNIGQSVQIKGELTGNEDLSIEGMVDGKINLKDHNLTIGKNGKITAEIHAKTVVIIGQVMGNVTADDKVEIHATGSVQGDIRAPRVVISDGAQFKGSIEMERSHSASSAKPATKGSGLSSVSTPELARSASSV
jgi:cytoskeletal protein CcmA (bactofilin family)